MAAIPDSYCRYSLPFDGMNAIVALAAIALKRTPIQHGGPADSVRSAVPQPIEECTYRDDRCQPIAQRKNFKNTQAPGVDAISRGGHECGIDDPA